MSKKISNDLTIQAGPDLYANQDVRAEDWKRMVANQNFVGAHKGMRFGGFSWGGTVTSSTTDQRLDTHITLAGYLQRPIEDDGYIVSADAWCKNITIDLEIYNVDNLNSTINGNANGRIKTLTLNQLSGSLGWASGYVQLDPANTTQNLQLDGDPALIEIIPKFSDNSGSWEIGQIDVFEKQITNTDRLVFRRTALAFPEVQNDGTVEVSNADTLNFGEGVTATHPPGDEAKIVGPKNTNQSTSYDEIQFSDSGDISVSVTTSTITDDSGEAGGTRLNVDIDENVTTTTDTRFDFYANGSFIEGDVDNMDFVDGNSINLTGTSTAGDDAELSIAVDESAINHNNLTNSSQSDAHHTKPTTGDGLTGTDTFAVDDPLELGTFRASSSVDTPAIIDNGTSPIDVLDPSKNSTKGELASFCTIYGIIVGEYPDGGPLSIKYTQNLSSGGYNSSDDELTIDFDDFYSSLNHYVPVGVSQNATIRYGSNIGTTGVDIAFSTAPGRFAIAILGWDADQLT